MNSRDELVDVGGSCGQGHRGAWHVRIMGSPDLAPCILLPWQTALPKALASAFFGVHPVHTENAGMPWDAIAMGCRTGMPHGEDLWMAMGYCKGMLPNH